VQLRLAEDETILEHLDTATWLRSFDDNVTEAMRFLEQYANAEAVRTPLLHCYLPCRSFKTPVKFIHSNMADPRFEGLVGLDDAPLNALHERFSKKFAIAMDAILAGKSREEVYGIWDQACAQDMAATDRLIEEQDAARKLTAAGISGDAFKDLPRTVYGPSERRPDDVNIIFCFDAKFAEPFLPTFASIIAHTERRLSIWVLGRDLPEAYFQTLTQLFPEVRFEHVDLSRVDYGEVRLLPHISVSTMDRLIAPDLMPDVDKALYLDVDILVRGDIGALWDLDLGPAAIAARDSIHREWNNGTTLIYDVAKRFSADKASQFRSMIFGSGRVRFDAFNAGVLVMDMAKLREDGFVRQTTSVVEAFGVHDQFALNIYTRDNRAKIPPAWNHFATQESLEDPMLVHFIGRVKPWTPKAYHAFKGEWEAHAAQIQMQRARLEQDEEAQ
jgi:lipopolysaccharide biosynthesis glycosyltransferase